MSTAYHYTPEPVVFKYTPEKLADALAEPMLIQIRKRLKERLMREAEEEINTIVLAVSKDISGYIQQYYNYENGKVQLAVVINGVKQEV